VGSETGFLTKILRVIPKIIQETRFLHDSRMKRQLTSPLLPILGWRTAERIATRAPYQYFPY